MGKHLVIVKNSAVQALYSDEFNLLPIAENVVVERASDVYFNPATQEWEIKLLEDGRILPFSFKKRKDAIAYEVEYLEKQLREKCSK